GGNLAGESEMTPEVGAMRDRLVIDVDDRIVIRKEFVERQTGLQLDLLCFRRGGRGSEIRRIKLVQYDDAAVIAEHRIDLQLFRRADHAFRKDAANLTFLNTQLAVCHGQHGAY